MPTSPSKWHIRRRSTPDTAIHRIPRRPAASAMVRIRPMQRAFARAQYSPFQVQRDFFTHALNNPDQLRQRVAFALSQIMVVSSVEIYEAYGLADYQNILLNDALGNYRTLLQDVTLSPTMGHYLDMANSDETNPQNGTVPNQNYAREVLQLFSIGLVELNPDGTQQLDANGAPIPTFRRRHDRGICVGIHGLDLSHRCPARLRSGPTPSTSMARWSHSPITTSPAPSYCSTAIPYRPVRRRPGSCQRARRHLQSSERRPVHQSAAHTASGHEQPEPGVCRARRRDFCQQRSGRAR
jgi:hypothetical protein